MAAYTHEKTLISFAAQIQLFVTIWASCICLHREILAVSAFPVRADAYFALLAAHFQQELPAIGALVSRNVIMRVGRTARGDGTDKLSRIVPHLIDEHLLLRTATAYKRQVLLPLRSQLG